MSSTNAAVHFPSLIYGIHDLDGHALMESAGRVGWLLDSVDLSTATGSDYSSLTRTGFGIIVRLNNGPDAAGTLPFSFDYDKFAARCAAYVQRSPGAHVWIIGNEINISSSRPGFPDGSRESITPHMYARCFMKCRHAIRSVPDHANDWVVPGAVSPYNAESGDWVQYLVEIMNLLGSQVDGIALHCYTHDFTIDQISSDDMMGAPFNNRHFNFRAYRDFLNALPAPFRSLPVFVTETSPYTGWKNANIRWVQAAYQEIDAWNADPTHQPIQALILYRWQSLPDHADRGIQDKDAIIADFQSALAGGCRVRWSTEVPPLPSLLSPPSASPEYRVGWDQVIDVPDGTMDADSTLTGRVVVSNNGTKSWPARGTNPVRLGYHWYTPQGSESPVVPYAGNFPMPRDVPPGTNAVFEGVELRAPKGADSYTLKWDLVHEGITWFGDRGSETKDVAVQVKPAAPPPPPPPPPQWMAHFLSHDTPVSERAGQTTVVNLRLKNTGARVWKQNGANPVHVGYKWFNGSGEQQVDVEDRRTALPMDVLPDQDVALGAVLVAPKSPGHYRLQWDLIAEGYSWFAEDGNVPLSVPVAVTQLPIAISNWRAEASLNPAQVALALDGDPQTFWDTGSPQVPGQWFRLNLSSPRVIDGIQLIGPGTGYPAGYVLRVSGDGKTWSEIARVPNGNANDVMAIFAPQPVQYVQIDLLAYYPSNWMISEILLHSAVAWSARASHFTQSANHAIDNRPDTAWSSLAPQAVGMWFQIDLGRVESISGLLIDQPPEESPANLRVTAWNAAASRWQIVCDVTNNPGSVNVTFQPIQTQFVNFQLLGSGATPWTIRRVHLTRELETWLGPTR